MPVRLVEGRRINFAEWFAESLGPRWLGSVAKGSADYGKRKEFTTGAERWVLEALPTHKNIK